MTSLSHWGMFEIQPVVMMIPAGFKLSQKDIDALRQPGRLIIVSRSDIVA